MTPGVISQALLMVRANVDPYAAFVKALLHLNSDFSDSATPATTWINGGSGAVITTAPADVLTGGGSLSCQSSNSDRIATGSTVLDVGTGDFCVELWFRDDDVATNGTSLWLLQGVATSQTVRVYTSGVGFITADVSAGGPAGLVAYSFDVWHHSAITRSGSNWTHWLDGVAVQTWTNGTFNTGTSSTNFWLGAASSANTSLMCLIDEFRITVGVPRYTTAFTPTYPFPNP